MEDMHIHLKRGVTDINIMDDYVKKCKKMKMERVLFLDHGNRESPKHTPVLNDYEVVKKFFENIDSIRKKYPEIHIYKGIESDFSYDEEFSKKEIKLINDFKFDIVIGSVHGMGKADYRDYLQANIDMINKYPINLVGHLKLRKEYEEYKDLIEEIVCRATKKNIGFDINTSDRSRWNLRQLEFMLGLFEKYGTKYTIGSDAHSIDEIGYEVEEMHKKIDKIKNNAEIEIEYSIVSRGTEKKGSKGYMGITKVDNHTRYLVLSKHFDKYIDTYKDSFKISEEYSIDNIAVSRFELMSALALEPIKKKLKDNILIVGFGNIGFSCLVYLINNGFKNIKINTREIRDFQKKAIAVINKKYSLNITFTEDYAGFDTYIEAVGNSKVIKNIIENANYKAKIILLGMAQDGEYLINPIDISRNNLTLIGGHELNGIAYKERNKFFQKILNENKKFDFSRYVNIYKCNDKILEKIMKRKENFIEVIGYDIQNQ